MTNEYVGELPSQSTKATGAIIEGRNLASGNHVGLCIDAGGVVVGHARHGLGQGAWHVGTTADEVMTPLLALTLGVLERPARPLAKR
jgi:hypothetical protein